MAELGQSRFLCAVGSSLLHVSFLLLLLMTLPSLGDRHINEFPSVVPIELVTIGDETNMAAMVSRHLPFAPSQQQMEAASPVTKAEVAPGLEMKLFPTKPSERQQNRSESEVSQVSASTDGKPAVSPRDTKIGDYDISKVGAGTAMTMSVADFLRNQIALCWRRAGAGEPEVVVVDLYLDGSGSIERTPRLIEPQAQTPGAIAATESVLHAIYTCAPYRLPPNRYLEWRRTTLTFDPRMIRGGTGH